MSNTQLPAYNLIDNQNKLHSFREENQGVDWLCFDTEFIGEKRYHTSLCLIQVMTEHGLYLIDPIEINDLRPFLHFIENESVVTITHAGENDYRLLYNQFDIIPKNLFDTQIAAAFAGHKYPVSFRKLVESELDIQLNKSHAVTDWESRPLSKKQIQYALDDVLPLYDLWLSLQRQLEKRNRTHWAEEEFALLESPDFYYRDPNHEALRSELMRSLNKREKVFLMRLLNWREETAERRNHSREMVLSSKLLSHLVRGISSGKEALFRNRRIPDKIVSKHGAMFEDLFQEPASEEEKAVLKQLKKPKGDDPREDMLQELLYLLVKYKCLENDITPLMVMPKNAIKKLQEGDEELERSLKSGWRRELLGDALVDWLQNFDRLDLKVVDNRIELLLKDLKSNGQS